MTVCFFGNYLKDYSRVSVLRRGLLENGVSVVECQTREKGFRKYWSLYRQHRELRGHYDIMLVAMGGQTLVWFARLLSRKQVVFDAFVSLYLTNVEDRQTCRKNSFRANYYAFWDWFSCLLAKRVFLDTKAQIDYFITRYNFPAGKFIRIFVGANDEFFFPSPKKFAETFLVHWHGYIVPFYGLQTVVAAAEKLQVIPAIKFRLVTKFNNQYRAIKELAEKLQLKNLEFCPETTTTGLATYIKEADVCLGVFGDNQKARVVVPNKIYEAIACAKPVITGKQKVLDEAFEDKKNIFEIAPNNSEELVAAIQNLYENRETGAKVGQQGYKLYSEKFAPAVLGRQLKNILESEM